MKAQVTNHVDTQFSFTELWFMFWGFGYRVNHNRKEIHRISNKKKNCKLDVMSNRTSEYVTKKKALNLIKNSGYNGCRWCWKETDKG